MGVFPLRGRPPVVAAPGAPGRAPGDGRRRGRRGRRGRGALHVLAAARHLVRHRHVEGATTPAPALVWTEQIGRVAAPI